MTVWFTTTQARALRSSNAHARRINEEQVIIATYRAKGRAITIRVGSFCLIFTFSMIALTILNSVSLRTATLTPVPWMTAILGAFIPWDRLCRGDG